MVPPLAAAQASTMDNLVHLDDSGSGREPVDDCQYGILKLLSLSYSLSFDSLPPFYLSLSLRPFLRLFSLLNFCAKLHYSSQP